MIKDIILLDLIEGLTKDEVEQLIDKNIIGRNAERNRKILKRRLLDGIYYEPLSEEFDLSIRQTQNIIYKGVNRLLVALKHIP